MAPPAISPTGNWIGTLLFALLALVAIILFAIRAGELIALLVKARRENRTDHIEDRIGKFFLVVLGQSGVLRDPIPGIAHFFTFWGFMKGPPDTPTIHLGVRRPNVVLLEI